MGMDKCKMRKTDLEFLLILIRVHPCNPWLKSFCVNYFKRNQES